MQHLAYQELNKKLWTCKNVYLTPVRIAGDIGSMYHMSSINHETWSYINRHYVQWHSNKSTLKVICLAGSGAGLDLFMGSLISDLQGIVEANM